jgi:hypothetical protein
MPYETFFRDGQRYRRFVDDGSEFAAIDLDSSRATATEPPPASPPPKQRPRATKSFSSVVSDLVAQGLPRDRAIKRAAADHPAAHAAFVRATDGQRHDAPLTAAERATIKTAWGVIMADELEAAGGDRIRAASSAARNHPELHRQFLRATNPGKM